MSQRSNAAPRNTRCWLVRLRDSRRRPHIGTAADSITFVFATFDRSPALYRYRFDDGLEEPGPPAVVHDDIVVHHAVAHAPDGAEVVYRLYHRGDLDMSQPRPTLLYGYGGWNIALVRGYLGI